MPVLLLLTQSHALFPWNLGKLVKVIILITKGRKCHFPSRWGNLKHSFELISLCNWIICDLWRIHTKYYYIIYIYSVLFMFSVSANEEDDWPKMKVFWVVHLLMAATKNEIASSTIAPADSPKRKLSFSIKVIWNIPLNFEKKSFSVSLRLTTTAKIFSFLIF